MGVAQWRETAEMISRDDTSLRRRMRHGVTLTSTNQVPAKLAISWRCALRGDNGPRGGRAAC